MVNDFKFNKKEFEKIIKTENVKKLLINEAKKWHTVIKNKPIQSTNDKFLPPRIKTFSHGVSAIRPRLFTKENRRSFYEWLVKSGTPQERQLAHIARRMGGDE